MTDIPTTRGKSTLGMGIFKFDNNFIEVAIRPAAGRSLQGYSSGSSQLRMRVTFVPLPAVIKWRRRQRFLLVTCLILMKN